MEFSSRYAAFTHMEAFVLLGSPDRIKRRKRILLDTEKPDLLAVPLNVVTGPPTLLLLDVISHLFVTIGDIDTL